MALQNNADIKFSSLLRPSQITCQTEQTDRDTLLLEMLRQLAYERGIGNVDEAYKAVLARERDVPTIVGPGIAMPHAKLEALDGIVVAVATSRNGIVYDRGQPDKLIKLIILTLAPKHAPGAYLQSVSCVAKICQDPTTAEVVSTLSTPEKIWNFFDEGGVALPDHLRARDIMDPAEAKLSEHDTLERAIDLFVRHRTSELPVVDKDGDLIGVVSTHELLRVCLPEYILWMDDLTPIMNFEPFAEILRKESQTWLTEIMTDGYAIVQVDEPAVQVAKQMTRERRNWAYVLQGRRLVGVVSLETFLNKILRE